MVKSNGPGDDDLANLGVRSVRSHLDGGVGRLPGATQTRLRGAYYIYRANKSTSHDERREVNGMLSRDQIRVVTAERV
jgi:hypothetical protein